MEHNGQSTWSTPEIAEDRLKFNLLKCSIWARTASLLWDWEPKVRVASKDRQTLQEARLSLDWGLPSAQCILKDTRF